MMLRTISRTLGIAVAALSLVAAVPLAAANVAPPSYSALYAFGDSLSDVGNIFTLSGHADPAPPYYNGQWSNGNVWLQTLAGNLGLGPLTPSVSGGTDFAYGGAQSGTTVLHTGNFTDLTGTGAQIAQFTTAHPSADPNALYAIWIGGNDLLGINAGTTPAQVQTLAGQTIGNIDSAIGALAGAGAKNFLVLTLPDVGKTPAALAGGPVVAAAASGIAASFNSLLLNGNVQAAIPALPALGTSLGAHLTVFDSYAFMDKMIAHPGDYGLTNVTDACLVGSTPCLDPGQYFFWDSIHPTATVHEQFGNAVFSALAVPEPANWLLMVAGLGIVIVALRRRA